jgi:ABC-type phosphate transport system substrate-binding protein
VLVDSFSKEDDLSPFRIIYISIAALFMLLLLGGQVRADTEFVVVVHRDNPVQRLSASEIKSIFLGKERFWPNGLPITLIMNKNEDIHESFTRLMLQKSPAQLSVYWKKILYSGASMLPLAVKDDEAVKSYMSLHVNTISYVDADSLDKQVRKMEVTP